MKKLWALIDVALDVAIAYHEARQPRKPRFAADGVLLVIAGLAVVTAMAFGLAAVYAALSGFGAALAALLTGVVALGVGIVAFALSRWIMRPKRR